MCPVPKSGDLSIISNHRPISLLSNLDKTLERLVFKHLYNHFRENNIITSFQSGFTPGDSTVNQPTYLYNAFCQALDSGKEVRVMFCDIKKLTVPCIRHYTCTINKLMKSNIINTWVSI